LTETDRARTQRVLPALRARAAVLRAIRAYFEAEGFLEVDAPLMVPSPGLDLHLSAFEVRGGAEARWLITSPEYQMKRLLAGGSGPIFQLAQCFRHGEIGRHHEPEVTLLEEYRPDAGAEDVMRDTERIVQVAAQALRGGTEVPVRGRPLELAGPWPRREVDALFASATGRTVDEVLPDEEAFFRLWVDAVEPQLDAAPCFVTG